MHTVLVKGSPFGGIPRNWKLLANNLSCPQYNHHGSPFGGIPRNWKPCDRQRNTQNMGTVPPSGGSLEIGNTSERRTICAPISSSPFGGIPRNWKPDEAHRLGDNLSQSSPFGGIPRNWKQELLRCEHIYLPYRSPFGGIPRNWKLPSSPVAV